MNININIRNKTKLVEKIKVVYLQITKMLASNYPILENLVPNKSWDIAIWSKW